jgi:hypothetical protein
MERIAENRPKGSNAKSVVKSEEGEAKAMVAVDRQ